MDKTRIVGQNPFTKLTRADQHDHRNNRQSNSFKLVHTLAYHAGNRHYELYFCEIWNRETPIHFPSQPMTLQVNPSN